MSQERDFSTVPMKLHKSILISLFVHMLAFGSAFAYAYYSGDAFTRAFDSMTVSLVELGDEVNSAKNRTKKQTEHTERQARSPEGTIRVAALPTDSIKTASILDRDRKKSNEDGADSEELATDSPEDQVAGGNFGVIPPEEWELIRAALERTRYYPRIARRRGIEGIVRLRFRIGSAGKAENVEIVKSSGFKMLDAASMRTVYRAGPLPTVKGWIEVPIGYVLK